jgi:Raf kinase inhibitor-like YbhB/YbcL family protein
MGSARALRMAIAFVWLAAVPACGGGDGAGPTPKISAPNRIPLASPNFDDGARMPVRFTCDAEEVSPTIVWSGVPEAAEYALTMVDVDAPGDGFVHWLVYGIPGEDTSLPQGAVPEGAVEGRNSFGEQGYAGPCPPPGDEPHRYVFTLYRLNTARGAGLAPGVELDGLLDGISCCVVATGTLTGIYGRG